MTVIKRSKSASQAKLVEALEQFIYLLDGQGEDEAVTDLRAALEAIKKNKPDSDDFKKAIAIIINSYEEHELAAYTHTRKKDDDASWTPADELYLSSTSVLNIAKRFRS